MQLYPIHITPVALFENPELVNQARDWFDDCEDIFSDVSGQEGKFRTTLNGYGTKSQINVSDSYFCDFFKETILINAKKLLESSGYDTAANKLKVNKIWLNEMSSGAQQENHRHYEAAISGCFYVDVPPESGGVIFETPLATINSAPLVVSSYTPYNSNIWTLNPQQGNMLMWQSFLPHAVPSTEFDGIRRSVAFDVTVE